MGEEKESTEDHMRVGHHFYPHSFSQNSVTEPNLTVREVGKCSLAAYLEV